MTLNDRATTIIDELRMTTPETRFDQPGLRRYPRYGREVTRAFNEQLDEELTNTPKACQYTHCLRDPTPCTTESAK